MESLPAMLFDALVYPWRDSGWMLILSGGFLLLLVMIVAGTGILGLIVLTTLGGYLTAHYFNVIETTLTGQRSQPEWPELTGDLWSDVAGPALRINAIHIIATLPALLLAVWAAAADPNTDGVFWLRWLALAFDCLYFPLAVVAVAMTGNLVSALPHQVLPAIMRGGLPYVTGAGLLFGIVAAIGVSFEAVLALPWIGWLLTLCGVMWVVLFHGRYCGLLYRRCEERVGWV